MTLSSTPARPVVDAASAAVTLEGSLPSAPSSRWRRWTLALLCSAVAAIVLAWVLPALGPKPVATQADPTQERAAAVASVLLAQFGGLDPIDRTLALREWEGALALKMRWVSDARPDGLAPADRRRIAGGGWLLADGGSTLWVAVPRGGAAGQDGVDLLRVEGLTPATSPTSGGTDDPRSSVSALAPGGLPGGLTAGGLMGGLAGAGLVLLVLALSRRRRVDAGTLPVAGTASSSAPATPATPAAPAAPPPFEAPAARPEAPAPARADARAQASRTAEEPADGQDLAGLLRREVERLRREQGPGPSADAGAGPDGPAGWPVGLQIDFDPWLEGNVEHQPALMARTIRGLLAQAADRARRHVVLSARLEGGRDVVIEIDDDGPSPLAASSARGEGGPGLPPQALATPDDADWVFAETVAQWHGGQASVECAPLGGLRRTIRWTVPKVDGPEAAPGLPGPSHWPPGLRQDRRRPASARGRRRSDHPYI